MESQSRRWALSTMFCMTAAAVGFAHYTIAGNCKVLKDSFACYHVQNGMGQPCSQSGWEWSCPHVHLLNQPVDACTNALPSQGGQTSCDDSEKVGVCWIPDAAACGPCCPPSCGLTGEEIFEVIPSGVLGGAACFG